MELNNIPNDMKTFWKDMPTKPDENGNVRFQNKLKQIKEIIQVPAKQQWCSCNSSTGVPPSSPTS